MSQLFCMFTLHKGDTIASIVIRSAALPCAGKSIYKLTLLVYAVGLALFCQPDPDGPRAVRVITQIPMRVRLSYVLVVYTRVYWPYTVLFLYFWAVLWLKKRCPWTEGY